MATKTLAQVFFTFGRNTSDDAERKKDDPVGYFSCRASTARFFDIEGLATPGLIISERSSSGRSRTLADGTQLAGQEGTPTEISTVKTQIVLPVSARGSRTVIIQTGNKIEDSQRKTNKDGAFHTVSFRFPSWATILTIADALASTIPEGKLNRSPGANQAFPYFKVKGGRSYPIMKRSAAISNTTAQTGYTVADLQALLQRANKQGIEGAG